MIKTFRLNKKTKDLLIFIKYILQNTKTHKDITIKQVTLEKLNNKLSIDYYDYEMIKDLDYMDYMKVNLYLIRSFMKDYGIESIIVTGYFKDIVMHFSDGKIKTVNMQKMKFS